MLTSALFGFTRRNFKKTNDKPSKSVLEEWLVECVVHVSWLIVIKIILADIIMMASNILTKL